MVGQETVTDLTRLTWAFIRPSSRIQRYKEKQMASSFGKSPWVKSQCRITARGFHRRTAGMQSTIFEPSAKVDKHAEGEDAALPVCSTSSGSAHGTGPSIHSRPGHGSRRIRHEKRIRGP